MLGCKECDVLCFICKRHTKCSLKFRYHLLTISCILYTKRPEMAENWQFFSLIDWLYAISVSQGGLVCQEMKSCAMQCYFRYTIIVLVSILN